MPARIKQPPEEYDPYLKEVVGTTRQWMRTGLCLPGPGVDLFDIDDDVEGWWDDDDVPEFPSPDQVRQEARENSEKIFASYNILKKIVVRHEETIQKRWTKKSRPQRLQCLLAS